MPDNLVRLQVLEESLGSTVAVGVGIEGRSVMTCGETGAALYDPGWRFTGGVVLFRDY